MLALNHDGNNIKFASKSIKNDREVLLKAYLLDEDSIIHFPKEL